MSTSEELDAAKLDGAAGRVRGVLRGGDDELLGLLVEGWPVLFEALDELVAVLDARDGRVRPPLF